jgi:acyl carrier protein phosphodiesterase
MNYLAHFYLSGKNDDILFGNFIGDTVKGGKWKDFPDDIQKGLLLHRYIDDFIDKNPFAQVSRKRIRDVFGITSPIVLDIYFDHFLSKNWMVYSSIDLEGFSKSIFDRLRPFKKEMPGYYPLMIEKMEQENWINSYTSIEGTAFALERMGKRVKFENNWKESESVLKRNYSGLQEDFTKFFPEIIKGVENSFDIKTL